MMECGFAKRCSAVLAVSSVLCVAAGGIARSEVASIYGGSDGLCGSRTASGERLNHPHRADVIVSPDQHF
jgi:hypothetical protein